MSISNILELFSGVALFLFGMTLMGEGLKKVAGSKLELVLYRLSSTPLKGILLGTGVTAVIQSSSATSVMVVGFVNSGMMKVRQAMGVIMGAIIGTSITGWVICLSEVGGKGGSIFEILSTDTFTAAMAIVGIIFRMFSKNSTKNHIGDIMLGFAVLMFGIAAMSDAVYPLRESQTFIEMLTTFGNPIIGILIGLVFTSVIQSASAAVGIMQALAVTGAITFDIALPITMGIGVGAAVPVLLSALGANANGKRTAFTYLLVDTLGAIVVSILYYGLSAVFSFGTMGIVLNMAGIALLNTLYRVVIVLILAPFLPLLEKLVNVFVKEEEENADLKDIDRLEERFLNHPTLAIEQSRLVINSMAEKAKENVLDAFSTMYKFTPEKFRKVENLEGVIDKYEDKLGAYLVGITKKELDDEQNKTVSKYLHTLTDFERISDHALNVGESAKEIHEKNIKFSDECVSELKVLSSAIEEILEITVTAFTESNLDLAFRVEPLEETIDDLCDKLKLHHIDRIRCGDCTYEHGFVFNDILTDFERISDHCSNIAIACIELESDIFDSHEYKETLQNNKKLEFEKMYNEYSEKYYIKS